MNVKHRCRARQTICASVGGAAPTSGFSALNAVAGQSHRNPDPGPRGVVDGWCVRESLGFRGPRFEIGGAAGYDGYRNVYGGKAKVVKGKSRRRYCRNPKLLHCAFSACLTPDSIAMSATRSVVHIEATSIRPRRRAPLGQRQAAAQTTIAKSRIVLQTQGSSEDSAPERVRQSRSWEGSWQHSPSQCNPSRLAL